MTSIFIKPGLVVHDRSRPVGKGLGIVVGPASRFRQIRICRWRGGQQHWSSPVVIARDQVSSIADWTQLPLTWAKRLAAAAFERNYLVRAMEAARGSAVDAARAAGVDRSNFRRLLQRHGLVKTPSRPRPRNWKKKSAK